MATRNSTGAKPVNPQHWMPPPITNFDHDTALEHIQEAQAILAAIRVDAKARHHEEIGLKPEEIITLTCLADGLLDEAHTIVDGLQAPQQKEAA